MPRKAVRAPRVNHPQIGSVFERKAKRHLEKAGITVEHNYAMHLGVAGRTKAHRFDMGSADPKVLIECKSHTWTSSGNLPSAKLTVWNEAMYYFTLAPRDYRKIFFVLQDFRKRGEQWGESLAGYYLRKFTHLIPPGVEVWEYSEASDSVDILFSG
ncbi:MAG: hypothetical protein KGQ42_01950 [Alphaproteobacteria bacterium]|nr:hypothetical protein [Alphaproteobacteria bacterium]MDE2339895.1 hypothetical protein [Alphaproteobacteria bacterium]